MPLLQKPNGIVASNHALVMMNYLFGFKGKQKRKQIRPMSNTHVWIYCYTTKGFIGEAISKAGLIAELMFDVMRRKDSLLPSPLTKHNIKGIDHSGYECETSF